MMQEQNMTNEVLLNNAFFLHLKKHYSKELKVWREPEWRICIPTSDALDSHEVFSQHFVECHALHQTSQLGVFTSLGCGKSITYELTENELVRHSHIYRGTSGGCNHEDEKHGRQSGVGLHTTRIPINDIYLETMEESLVHILVVSAVLDSTIEEETYFHTHLDSVRLTTNEEAEQFLNSFSSHQPVLDSVAARLHHWQAEAAASQPLQEMQTYLNDVLVDCWEDIIRRHSLDWQTNKIFQDLLYNALDFVVVGKCHSMLWWRIREKCGSMDDLVSLRLKHLRTACFTHSQLQLPELCEITTPAAVVELAALGNLESAIARLHSMHAAIELLQAHGKQARAELQSFKGSTADNERLSSVSEEEVLGLLTMAIIEAQCPHLVSNLYYTSHYVFSLPDNHPLRSSGNLVRTALKSIMQLDISEVLKTPTKPPIRKEMSLYDLMQVANAVEQRFERPRREEVGQSTPDISSLDLYYQQLTDRVQRSTMETSSIDLCPSVCFYSPISEASFNSPYSPLGSPVLPNRTAQAGLVNSIVEFFSAFPSSIRASLRRKQTERREAVASATVAEDSGNLASAEASKDDWVHGLTHGRRRHGGSLSPTSHRSPPESSQPHLRFSSLVNSNPALGVEETASMSDPHFLSALTSQASLSEDDERSSKSGSKFKSGKHVRGASS
ncbi:uncharacterized protein LOC108678485 [Hyalella azteca]|uniref:Uncharacterized protein LOC108678485 n=1 Tax=Hyalella azteca TaxID=294128 RepID=A0A8B7P9F3_HYAAZ|nr:uncharacterized protein LOC108678485 [Hyalella azteca]